MSSFGPYKGVVDQVHDGDTVYVKLDVGFDLTVYTRVRVMGMDAPELKTPEGKAARDFAQALLPVGREVAVISHGWDKYGGRIDGEIMGFASAMIGAGHAKPWDGKGPKP